jgi:hypothetical protein
METLTTHLIGQQVLIRSNMSGVHYGTLHAVSGNSARLENSRRLYKWSTGGKGVSLSEVAITGIDHANSQITAWLPDIIIGDVCEIIPTHGMADATISGAKVHTP